MTVKINKFNSQIYGSSEYMNCSQKDLKEACSRAKNISFDMEMDFCCMRIEWDGNHTLFEVRNKEGVISLKYKILDNRVEIISSISPLFYPNKHKTTFIPLTKQQ
jgi:hypothetical protein